MDLDKTIVTGMREDLIDIMRNMKRYIAPLRLDSKKKQIINNKLEIELEKLEQNTLTIGVVGVMKAGKSTFINAMIGEELLPSRNLGMTYIPTKIQHKHGLDHTEYIFKDYKCYQDFADWIYDNKSNKSLLQGIKSSVCPKFWDELMDGSIHFNEKLIALDEIQKELFNINDLARVNTWLCSQENNKDKNKCTINLLDRIIHSDSLPIIYTKFKALDGIEKNGANLAIIDSPGPDEAGHSETLQNVISKVLSDASGVFCILNLTSLNSESQATLRAQVSRYGAVLDDRLHIVVNQYDQAGQDMTLDALKSIIVDSNMFGDLEINPNRIYPLSAKKALYSRLVLMKVDEITTNYDKYRENPPTWLSGFSEILGGWEDFLQDLNDEKETGNSYLKSFLNKKAKRQLVSSKLNEFIDNSFSDIYKNSSINVIKSASNKLHNVLDNTLMLDARTTLEMSHKKKDALLTDRETLILLQKDICSLINKSKESSDKMMGKDIDLEVKKIVEDITHNIDSNKNKKKTKLQKTKDAYQKVVGCLLVSNTCNDKSKAIKKSDEVKANICNAIYDFKEEAYKYCKGLMHQKINTILKEVESDQERVICQLNQFIVNIEGWSFCIKSIDEFSNDLDLSDITPSQKTTTYRFQTPRSFLGLGSSIFEGLLGYSTEKRHSKRYQVNISEIQKKIDDFIKEMVLHAFNCAVQIIIDYQSNMQSYSSLLTSAVEQSIEDKNRNNEVVEKEIAEIKIAESWFEDKIEIINCFQVNLKGAVNA